MTNLNKAVAGAKEYYPLNDPEIGVALPKPQFQQNAQLPLLFRPFKSRDVEFKNRIFVAPMALYSSDDGHATDWHLVHYGGLATRGVGAVCIEATAVLPEGRVSPEDAGIWTDSHIEPLKRVVDFAHAHGTAIGVQLQHSGRKGSTYAPWVYADAARSHKAGKWMAEVDEGGWPEDIWAPSAIKFSDDYPQPKEMDEQRMKDVEEAFVAAVKRCEAVGFDFIELHGAHGYLLHNFCSPLSNTRQDNYGGSLENRLRYPLRIAERCREVWPLSKPLFYRLSATDWAEGPERDDNGKWMQWGIEQSVLFSGELKKRGVDLIHVSSGGLWSKQKIPALEDCATSSLLGLTTEGWHGHEVFYIIADEICWEGGLDQTKKPIKAEGRRAEGDKVGSLDLLKTAWAGRYQSVSEEFWAENPRRSFFDCSKAERVLGWKHSV